MANALVVCRCSSSDCACTCHCLIKHSWSAVYLQCTPIHISCLCSCVLTTGGHVYLLCIYSLYLIVYNHCNPAAISILKREGSVGNQVWLAAGWSDHVDFAKCHGQDWLACWTAFGCQQCLHVPMDNVHAHYPVLGEETPLGEPC